ncbi:MAG: hypothetical protein LH610_01570 [Sphingomonas bacterium]|nr:hypothetical protein [Sphingomonas bacterium]
MTTKTAASTVAALEICRLLPAHLIAAAALAALSVQPVEAKPKPKKGGIVLVGKTADPVIGVTTAPLNLNTAGKPELAPLPVLSSEAKAAILNFRAGGAYTSGADFAAKVCSRVAVDFGPTNIMIGTALYQGFTCAVPASGSYWADGAAHPYTVAVEVTGSAVLPPAPPAQ